MAIKAGVSSRYTRPTALVAVAVACVMLGGCVTTKRTAHRAVPCSLPGATSGGCETTMLGSGQGAIITGSVEKSALPPVDAVDVGEMRGSIGSFGGAPAVTTDPMANDFVPAPAGGSADAGAAAMDALAEAAAPSEPPPPADPAVAGAVAAVDDVARAKAAEGAAEIAEETRREEKKRRIKVPVDRGSGKTMTLADAVGRAISMHPRVGMARAKADQSKFGVDIAKSARRPDVELTLGAGHDTLSYYDYRDNLVRDIESLPAARVDGKVSIRQTLYDFGLSGNDIARSKAQNSADLYFLKDRIEEISLDTVNAYLRILEQRELVGLADEQLAAHQKLARIVEENEKDGNSTVADVKRVAARLVDVETERTNLDNDLQSSIDKFRRLARVEPGRLVRPPLLRNTVPANSKVAIEQVVTSNPRLLGLEKQIDASNRELDSQLSKFKPKVSLELEGDVKNYVNSDSRSEMELRGMVVLSHKLYDGGERRGYAEQIRARIDEGEMRYTDTRDEFEADVRQNYRSIDSSRRQMTSLREGVESSAKVRELYLDQFKGGKRTIFELLDSETSYYTAKRELITNQFEELRATYQILRAMGRLAETIAASQGR
ncbi:MAG: TolC family protein [Hyphomicrobiales bacterium]